LAGLVGLSVRTGMGRDSRYVVYNPVPRPHGPVAADGGQHL
jgi:hypothetical protein